MVGFAQKICQEFSHIPLIKVVRKLGVLACSTGTYGPLDHTNVPNFGNFIKFYMRNVSPEVDVLPKLHDHDKIFEEEIFGRFRIID